MNYSHPPRLCDASSFAALGVIAPLCLRLDLLQLHRPMEAQALAWPHLHSGEDAVLVSEAGSGKTLSYLLPLIQSVWEAEERGDAESGQVAVVVPTQDLAVQVLRVARQLCAERAAGAEQCWQELILYAAGEAGENAGVWSEGACALAPRTCALLNHRDLVGMPRKTGHRGVPGKASFIRLRRLCR